MDIRFEDVRVSRDGAVSLHVPRLTIAGGKVTALLGPNGSGKTTLLRAVAALERLQTGQVLLDEQPARGDRATRDAISFAFQAPVFVTGTVRANLELGLRLRHLAPAERSARTEVAAASLGVGHLLDREAQKLSGGEAQRVNLARALALQAPVTLLDEPLAGLDAPSRESLLRDLPRILGELATVVVVTHERDEAARLAEDVVLLVNGLVVAAGSLSTVFTCPPNLESARLLGWALVPSGDGFVAIRPGALSLGEGHRRFTFEAEQIVQVGARWEILGLVEGVPTTLAGHGTAPRDRQITVSVSADDGISFASAGNP